MRFMMLMIPADAHDAVSSNPERHARIAKAGGT